MNMPSLLKQALFLLLFGFCCSLSAQQTININGSETTALRSASVPDNELLKKAERYREFNANPQLRSIKPYNVGDTLLLDFFDDRRYKAVIKTVTTDISGIQGITSQIAGTNFSYCYMAVSPEGTFMSALLPEYDESYTIGKVENTFYLSQYSMSEFHKDDIPCGEPLHINEEDATKADSLTAMPVLRSTQEEVTCPSPDVDEPATIDIMIVYTPAALTWMNSNYGSVSALTNIIMQQSNLVLNNSDTGVTLNLVYTHLTNYTEVNSSVDLQRLQDKSDGYMDEVHTLRKKHKADLVLFLADISYAGGQAFLLKNETGNPNDGFCIVRIQQAILSYTSIHEIGHNMGCGHHKDQMPQSAGPALFPYSAGWRGYIGTIQQEQWCCSVMSYELGIYYNFWFSLNSIRIPYFSSPDITVDEIVIGDAANADNARTIRQTKHVISRYSSPSIEFTQTSCFWLCEEQEPDLYDCFTLKEALLEGDQLEFTRASGTTSGTYPVTVRVFREEEDITCEYFVLSNPSFIIVRRPTITLSMSNQTLTFTGDSLSVVPAAISNTYGREPDIEISYSYRNLGDSTIYAKAFNAGMYYVFAFFKGDNCYVNTYTDCILTVTKATSSIALQDRTLKYTGHPAVLPLPVTVPADASLTVTYTGTGETVYPESATAPTDIGTYSVKMTYAGNNNYEATTVYAVLTINATGDEPLGDSDPGGVTIGAGTPPAQGALLQIKENDNTGINAKKGLLLPRVNLTNLNSLDDIATGLDAAEHIGLIVYNVNEDASAGIYKGVYSWNGTAWKRLNAP